MSWLHPVDLWRTRSCKRWRILLNQHFCKSLALAIVRGGGQRVVCGNEKDVFCLLGAGPQSIRFLCFAAWQLLGAWSWAVSGWFGLNQAVFFALMSFTCMWTADSGAMCSWYSDINQFPLHPSSAFPLSSLLSQLTAHPSPSPPFISIVLLLGGPKTHACYSTGTMRAAGCIFLYYWHSSPLCCENITSHHVPILWRFQSLMLAGHKDPFSPCFWPVPFLCH